MLEYEKALEVFNIKFADTEPRVNANKELARGRQTYVMGMLFSHLTEEPDKTMRRKQCKLTLQKAEKWGVGVLAAMDLNVKAAMSDLV